MSLSDDAALRRPLFSFSGETLLTMSRLFYLCLGSLCLLLGLAGVVLPLLPTTPFIILAAFCFSRSSRRLHRLLVEHRLFGPLIRDWEAHGVIPLKVKWVSSTMMVVMVAYPVLGRALPLWADVGMVLVVLAALIFIWSRPSRPAPAAPVRGE